jgi:hypothetical protein
VRCDLAGVDHPKPRPESCNLEYGDSFALADHGRGFRVCHGDTARDPKALVLDYGEKKRIGPFTCKVRRTRGMRCTSRRGHGFGVSRERQRLW